MKKKLFPILLSLLSSYGCVHAQSGVMNIINQTNCDVTAVVYAQDLSVSSTGCDFISNVINIPSGNAVYYSNYVNFNSIVGWSSAGGTITGAGYPDANFSYTDVKFQLQTCYTGNSPFFTVPSHNTPITVPDPMNICSGVYLSSPSGTSYYPGGPTITSGYIPGSTTAPFDVVFAIF